MKQVFFVVCCLMILTSHAQRKSPKQPEIGKPFLDFHLDSVYNYSKKSILYNDFKGKWIILDFWGENCSGCIKSMPKIDELQRKYNRDVQFIFVGEVISLKNAKTLFNKLNSKFNFVVPVSLDQSFIRSIGIAGLPTYILISPSGIVAAITDNITEANIKELLAGGNPQLQRIYLTNELTPSDNYNRDAPLLIKNNGGDEMDYMYRSVIAKWNPSMPTVNTFISKSRLEIFRFDLKKLYRLAYFGKEWWPVSDTFFYGNYYPVPFLEINDSSFFQSDYYQNKNYFSYSLSYPVDVIDTKTFNPYTLKDKPKFQKALQRDLENCFGYTAEIQTRTMPCLYLVATSDARLQLKTKGGKSDYGQYNGNRAIDAKNISINELIGLITQSIEFPLNIPIINETGITYNIDIEIDAIYYNDWIKRLQNLGLDLVIGQKEMKVLVIRDAEPSNN